MEYLIALIVGMLGNLLVAEIIIYHKRVCSWIIGLAASRIDEPGTRATYHEEWLAALNDHAGVFASFAHAIGCFWGAHSVAVSSKKALAANKATKSEVADAGFQRTRRLTARILLKLPFDVSLTITSETVRRLGFEWAYVLIKNLQERTSELGASYWAMLLMIALTSVVGFFTLVVKLADLPH